MIIPILMDIQTDVNGNSVDDNHMNHNNYHDVVIIMFKTIDNNENYSNVTTTSVGDCYVHFIIYERLTTIYTI